MSNVFEFEELPVSMLPTPHSGVAYRGGHISVEVSLHNNGIASPGRGRGHLIGLPRNYI